MGHCLGKLCNICDLGDDEAKAEARKMFTPPKRQTLNKFDITLNGNSAEILTRQRFGQLIVNAAHALNVDIFNLKDEDLLRYIDSLEDEQP